MHSLKWYFYALFSQQNSGGDHSLLNFLCPFYFEHFFVLLGMEVNLTPFLEAFYPKAV